jgi:hypothetical protein
MPSLIRRDTHGPAATLTALLLVAVVSHLSGLRADQSEMVIAKEGTTAYHRPGCEVIRDGKGVLAMTRAQAEGRGLKSHDGCDPAKKPPPSAATAPAPPAYVFVDGGKYYHRESCKRLGKDRRKVRLDDAGVKYWPCPACKPPIRKRPR